MSFRLGPALNQSHPLALLLGREGSETALKNRGIAHRFAEHAALFAGSLAGKARGCRGNPHGFSRGIRIVPKPTGNRFNGLPPRRRRGMGLSTILRIVDS